MSYKHYLVNKLYDYSFVLCFNSIGFFHNSLLVSGTEGMA